MSRKNIIERRWWAAERAAFALIAMWTLHRGDMTSAAVFISTFFILCRLDREARP